MIQLCSTSHHTHIVYRISYIIYRMAHTININRREWFTHLVGKPEPEWTYELEEVPPPILDKMGNFTISSLRELEASVHLPKSTKTTHITPLTIRTRGKYTHEELFDTSALQSTAPPNAIFQVASNFNCLEVSSCTDNPFDGTYLTFLMEDKTQGPSAMGGTACGSMAILHHHHRHPISLLDHVTISDKNGKLYETKISNKQVEQLKREYQEIQVGILENTCACMDRNKTLGKTVTYNPHGPRIHQVLTSTCIVRKSSKKAIELQELLLSVSYRCIYLLAIQKRSPLVVLTFVGGGVFRNDMNTIINVIYRTHCQYSPYLPKGCKVVLPVYVPRKKGDARIVSQFQKVQKENNGIPDIVHEHV